jgi:aminoglycoside/choline kinase family phosphotransferase
VNDHREASPDARRQALEAWCATVLPSARHLRPASDDASFRRYFRVDSAAGSRILLDAPPEHEALGPWLEHSGRLASAGVRVPRVEAVDEARGYVLMEDLGETVYLPVLATGDNDQLYDAALRALLRLQLHAEARDLPEYDHARLAAEIDLFPRWLLERHLGLPLSPARRALWSRLTSRLIGNALAQPQVYVHRDFHSRNLTPPRDPADEPGVLDFQDALRGPVTYDLVSLLRDCYIAWPEAYVRRLALDYRARLAAAGLDPGSSEAVWLEWFDLMGVQRHLKAAGIFCRLYHRDGKARYLADIPRVLAYLERVCAAWPDLADFAGFIGEEVLPAWRASAAPQPV